MKKLIFLGGEAGVGKSSVANYILERNQNIQIIDKDESTSVFTSFLLEQNGKEISDRESEFYLSSVKPLEYKQIEAQMLHLIKSSSVMVTAPFFDNFLDVKWMENMRFEADYHDAEIFFFYLTRNSERILNGLKDRGASRDRWKIENYINYRKQVDELNLKILNNKEIIKINMDGVFEFKIIEELIAGIN